MPTSTSSQGTKSPPAAEGIGRVVPIIRSAKPREGRTFHHGKRVTAGAVAETIAALSGQGHPRHDVRAASLLGLAEVTLEEERTRVSETNAPDVALP